MPARTDKWYLSLKDRICQKPGNFPQWKVENQLIYKFIPNQLPFQANFREWKLLVPKSQREEIMRSCHDPPTSAHFGFFKTFSRVQEHYFWPKMRTQILSYVRACSVCAEQKVPTKLRPGRMGKEKRVSFPFQIIAIDGQKKEICICSWLRIGIQNTHLSFQLKGQLRICC